MEGLRGYDNWATQGPPEAEEVTCEGEAWDACPAGCDEGAVYFDDANGTEQSGACNVCRGKGQVNPHPCEADALVGYECEACGCVNDAPSRSDYYDEED